MLRNFITRYPSRKTQNLLNVEKKQILLSTTNPVSRLPFSSSSKNNNVNDSPKSQAPMGLFRLLNNTQRELWESQLKLSQRAKEIVSQIPVTGSNSTSVTVKENTFFDGMGIPGLESTFSVVIAGEFNAGKSTIINALIGQELLESGALPTTDSITILTSSASSKTNNQKSISSPAGVSIIVPESPISILRDLTLIDTPGTNTCLFDHTSRTLRLLPSADIILFVTSAERPLTQSEQTLLQSMLDYRKQIVLIVNKMDVLESLGADYGRTHKNTMIQFVKEQLGNIFVGSHDPLVFCVSARDALNVKKLHNYNDETRSRDQNMSINKGMEMWERSQFEHLEQYLKHTLTEQSKIRTKMMNPIGVTEGMTLQAQNQIMKAKEELETDVVTLNLVLSQLEGWKKDIEASMQDDCHRDVDILLQNEKRIISVFFNDLNIWSLWTLNDGSFHETWKNSASSAGADDHLVWNMQKVLGQWSETFASKIIAQSEATLQYLGKRPAVINHNLIGHIHSGNFTHSGLRETVQFKLAKSILNTKNGDFSSSHPQLIFYDSSKEATHVYESIQFTKAISGVLQCSSLTMGILSYMEYLDFYIFGPSSIVMMLMGVFNLPMQRIRIQKQYEQKISDAKDDIESALNMSISREITHKVYKQMVEGMDPYKRYVETEQKRINQLLNECEDILAEAFRLRNKIKKMGFDEKD